MESIQNQNYKNPSVGEIIGGVMVGSSVQNLTNIPRILATPQIANKMAKINNSLTADEFVKVEKAVEETMKSSGLSAKGVSIIKATAENAKEITEIMNNEYNKGFLKHLPKYIKDKVTGNAVTQVKDGKNAFYAFAGKKIVRPEKGLELAFFHEAGHAMNANLSKLGKILQKCRPLTLLAIPISLIALWKTKKAPGEEPKNGLDKATNFVKNNAGKLTFATFLPVLLEEGMATLKGNNLAKKLLSPEIAKKVAKTNALGFTTYLLMATVSGLGVYLGAKVKDSIASKKLTA